jgi:hypothetical protein
MQAEINYYLPMSVFDPAFHLTEPVGPSAIGKVREKIHSWITCEAFRDLLELFVADVDLQGPLDEVLQGLEVFSNRWDFRRIAREQGLPADDALKQALGSARWLSASSGLQPEAGARVLDDANRLGLVVAQEPSETVYDWILVLGGARLSCKLRPIRAAEVIASGVHIGAVALLGAARPVADSERDATDTYAPGAKDEFDLIVAGAQQALGFRPVAISEERYDHPNDSNLSWMVRRFEGSFGSPPLDVMAVSAPSSDPLRRRANSADTLMFFLDHEKVTVGSRILMITSQIYVPYTQLEGLRSIGLPRGLRLETIGFPGDRIPEIQGMSSPNHYLQEVRSTIQAARRFCEAYPMPKE